MKTKNREPCFLHGTKAILAIDLDHELSFVVSNCKSQRLSCQVLVSNSYVNLSLLCNYISIPNNDRSNHISPLIQFIKFTYCNDRFATKTLKRKPANTNRSSTTSQ